MPAWKDEVAARVRAHRNKSSRVTANQPTLPGMEGAFSQDAVAARVAERYARLPSWREMLTAQAAAKSTVDSLVAAASAELPAEPEPQQLSIDAAPRMPEAPAIEADDEPYQPDLLRYSVSVDSLPTTRFAPPEAFAQTRFERAENRPGPLENAVVEPTRPLPTTLITTPRELVAPRKARPRLAEGPLCDELADTTADPASAPIREKPAESPPVEKLLSETSRLGYGPPSVAASPRPLAQEWHSIHLDSEVPIRETAPSSSAADRAVLHVAPLEDRAIAALVDCALTLCAFLLFSGVFALSSTVLPHGRAALIGAATTLFTMGLLYQYLFFTLTDATPGMRYAKIALCTFDDDNPPRRALQGRIGALLLSALPLGLGFLWAIFDEDSLGWHDRITRTYQRSYRDK
jgi:uncharacterized RDD family membrane protein YckC